MVVMVDNKIMPWNMLLIMDLLPKKNILIEDSSKSASIQQVHIKFLKFTEHQEELKFKKL